MGAFIFFEVQMKEHGSYDLDVQKQTITFSAYDSWNYQTAQRWGDEIKSIVTGFENKEWACIVDLTMWELATPDIRGYLVELYMWLNDNNLKYLAVVFGLSIHKEILEKTYVVLTNVKKEYCESLDEAREYLDRVGF
jgi:hypothetical protein